MDQTKQWGILVILMVILSILVVVCYEKYKPNGEVNTYKKEETTTQDNNVTDMELINKLYSMVSINYAATENIDYYLNDETTYSNMSDELKSYLLLKNLKPSSNQEIKDVDIKNKFKMIFNIDEELNPIYSASIGNSTYTLSYDSEKYVLSSTPAIKTNKILKKKITSAKEINGEIVIEESFELDNEEEDLTGNLTYRFSKNNNNEYYFNKIERKLN